MYTPQCPSTRLFRTALCLIALHCCSGAALYAQKERFQELLDKGKNAYRSAVEILNQREDRSSDSVIARGHLNDAIGSLLQAAEIDSTSQEANYFLANAYDKIFSGYSPGDNIPFVKLENTRIISKYLERVIAISPNYDGEIVILEPHEKLSSMWGSLAAAYAVRGFPDSARWALREGRRAGGFLPLSTELCRNILKSCGNNAIIMVGGDADTFPMWYLQEVEGYRTDVTIVNTSLLNTRWYPKWLMSGTGFGAPLPEIGYSPEEIDRLSHRNLEHAEEYRLPIPAKVLDAYGIDTSGGGHGVEDGGLGLMVGHNNVLMIEDQIILNMVTTNRWERPVYFSITLSMEKIVRLGLEWNLKLVGAAMQIYPMRFTHESTMIDVEAVEALLLSNGDDAFSWEGWQGRGAEYGERDKVSAVSYFFLASCLVIHYLQNDMGRIRTLRLIMRMKKIFPPEYFAEQYNGMYESVESATGTDLREY